MGKTVPRVCGISLPRCDQLVLVRDPGCQKRTYTCVPDAIHTLQSVQSVWNERVREFHPASKGASAALKRG
jgi:hypothetical protein